MNKIKWFNMSRIKAKVWQKVQINGTWLPSSSSFHLSCDTLEQHSCSDDLTVISINTEKLLTHVKYENISVTKAILKHDSLSVFSRKCLKKKFEYRTPAVFHSAVLLILPQYGVLCLLSVIRSPFCRAL